MSLGHLQSASTVSTNFSVVYQSHNNKHNIILPKTSSYNNYYAYRLALQAVPRSSICQPINTISSVARKFSSAVVLTPALILTRLAWQAYVSVIYVS